MSETTDDRLADSLDLSKVPDDLDLWVTECGMLRETSAGEPILTDELWADEREDQTTFEQTIEQVRTVEPGRTVLTEIEEIYRRRPGEYSELAAELEREHEDIGIAFGRDGMTLEV